MFTTARADESRLGTNLSCLPSAPASLRFAVFGAKLKRQPEIFTRFVEATAKYWRKTAHTKRTWKSYPYIKPELYAVHALIRPNFWRISIDFHVTRKRTQTLLRQ